MQKDIILSGLTTTPSSDVSQDGQLAAMLNLVNEGGALKPIGTASSVGKIAGNIQQLWVHETADYLHYIKIIKEANDTYSWWWKKDTLDNDDSGAKPTVDTTIFYGGHVKDSEGALVMNTYYLKLSEPAKKIYAVLLKETKDGVEKDIVVSVFKGFQEGIVHVAETGAVVSPRVNVGGATVYESGSDVWTENITAHGIPESEVGQHNAITDINVGSKYKYTFDIEVTSAGSLYIKATKGDLRTADEDVSMLADSVDDTELPDLPDLPDPTNPSGVIDDTLDTSLYMYFKIIRYGKYENVSIFLEGGKNEWTVLNDVEGINDITEPFPDTYTLNYVKSEIGKKDEDPEPAEPKPADPEIVEEARTDTKGWTEIKGVPENILPTDLTYNGNTLVACFGVDDKSIPVQYIMWSEDDQTYNFMGTLPKIDLDFELRGSAVQRTYTGKVKLDSRTAPTRDENMYTEQVGVITYWEDDGWGKVFEPSYFTGKGLKNGETYYIKNTNDHACKITIYTDTITYVPMAGNVPSRDVANEFEIPAKEGMEFTHIEGMKWNLFWKGFRDFQANLIISKKPDTQSSDDEAAGTFDSQYVPANNADNITAIKACVEDFTKVYCEDKGQFIYPFFVRYGIKLYDGRMVNMSAPMLMVPNWSTAPVMLMGAYSDDDEHKSDATLKAWACQLYYKVGNIENLDKWSDIIEGVSISISKPIFKYNGEATYSDAVYQTLAYDITKRATHLAENYGIIRGEKKSINESISDTEAQGYSCIVRVPVVSAEAFKRNLQNASNFYELKVLKEKDIKSASDFKRISTELHNIVYPETDRKVTVSNLTDNSIWANKAITYNSRLHLANVKEELNTYGAAISPVMYNEVDTYRLEIVSKTRGKTSAIRTPWMKGDPTSALYFFSNNSSVTKVTIYFKDSETDESGVTTITYKSCHFEPEAHEIVEGSYVYASSGIGTYLSACTQEEAEKDVTEKSIITHANEVYVSEVDNPFYFPADAAVRAGRGTVVGMSVNTETIAEGQFGDAPLYVFTTEETWVFSLSQEGKYSTRQPLEDMVCINTNSITPLSNGTLFCTKQGIMYAQGKQVQCISDELYDMAQQITLPHLSEILDKRNIKSNGNYLPNYLYGNTSWQELLKTCRMVRDDRNQRVYVYVPGKSAAYVFSLKSKLWGFCELSALKTIDRTDHALVLSKDSTGVLNLMDIADASTYAPQMLITRPLKMDAPDVLKRIRSMIARGYFRQHKTDVASGAIEPSVSTALYGSRDLFNWNLIWTSKDKYLRGFSGTPYKYYIAVLACNLEKDESISLLSFDVNSSLDKQMR